MKRILLGSFVLLMATSLAAMAQTKKPISRQGLVNAVRINGYFEALKANEIDKAGAYFTNDYTFTGQDGKMVSRAERLKTLREQGSNLVSVADIATRIYGDAGIVTGTVTTKSASGGTEQSRFLQVWVWQKGDWFVAASQATRIQ
ncbi:MAG TPA: nuclear transport factor 2 family protein [Pyrinomonadaceae bacterium]|nr:nuclear transport factor 2 family protein [Pyrinomonadaceae bacterium]